MSNSRSNANHQFNNVTLSGTVVAPTPVITDNSTTVATTAFVKAQSNAASSPGRSYFTSAR